MNVVILLGRLGSDIAEHETKSGSKFYTASLATNRGVKKSDGSWEEVTDWHEIIVFGHSGKYLFEKFKKGSQVTVNGRIEYKKYLSQAGEQRSTTRIVVEDLK